MKPISDLTPTFLQMFPTLPRTVLADTTTNQLFTHTGHSYLGAVDPVSMPIAGQEPTEEELSAFARLFEQQRDGRGIYSFVNHLIVIEETQDETTSYALFSMPVFVLRAQTTPKVVYRGANKNPTPSYATKNSIGFDICSDVDFLLAPGERKLISTALYLDITDWDSNQACYLRIAPKSKLALKHGLDVLAGVVDADYPAEIGVVLFNHGKEPFEVKIGESIAQGIWEVAMQGGNLVVAGAQRAGGFGSTGK